MPTEIPSATTPGITAGTKVTSLAEVGNKVFAAGSFTQVGGQTRTYVAAFDRVTGALDATFNPTILGEVYAVTPGPTSNTVYVAGILRNVNGVALSKVALLDATTGAPVSGFKPPTINGTVQDLKYRAGNLYLAGDFTLVGTTARGGLASLQPDDRCADQRADGEPDRAPQHRRDEGAEARRWEVTGDHAGRCPPGGHRQLPQGQRSRP